MSLRFSTALRTDFAQALANRIAGGQLRLFSAAEPSGGATDPDPAGLLASGALPAPALTASGGQTTQASSWAVTGSAGGTMASFRAYDAAGVCHIQGSITATGGGGDMTADDLSIVVGRVTLLSSFNTTFGNS